MNIVHIITQMGGGGAERMLFGLLSNSAPSCPQPYVISLVKESVLGTALRNQGIEIHSLNMRRNQPNAQAFLSLLSLLRRIGPNLVVSWLYHADLLAVLAKILNGRWPLLWNLRGSARSVEGREGSTPLLHRFLARLSAYPDGIIVNSQAGLEYHTAIGYRPQGWHVIPNGIDVDHFKPDFDTRSSLREQLGLPDDAFIIAMPARFHPIKGHRIFMAAARQFAERHRNVRFVLLGYEANAENSELTSLVESHAIGSLVRLLGAREDIHRLYSAFDIVTLSSWHEGFPNVLAEAMACEVPCVSTDAGDAGLIIGDTGIMVPPGDPDALSHAWDCLLSLSEPERRRLGKSARARISEHYALPHVTRQYNDLFATYIA